MNLTADVSSKTSRWLALLACVLMLGVYAMIALSAVSGKSATFDEPLHLVSGYVEAHWHDYRCDPEDPALFKRIAVIGMPSGTLYPNPSLPSWQQMFESHILQVEFANQTLFKDRLIDANAVLAASRRRLALIAVAAGALISWWAFRLGGVTGAIVATAAFCFDPNFLAHGPLVKNDVASALAMVGLFFCTWRCGQQATPWRCAVLALAAGFAATVKFSGVFGVMLAVAILFCRALLPGAWIVLRSRRGTRLARLVGAAIVSLIMIVGCWIIIWAAYGFRFAPTPDGEGAFDLREMTLLTSTKEYLASHPGQTVTYSAAHALPLSLTSRLILAAAAAHLTPQAYLAGFLYTYQSTLLRDSYLLGQYSEYGWWYYFPVVIAVKTPLALLAAMLLSFALAISLRNCWARNASTRWSALCVMAPPAVYLLMTMRSDLNLGLRHLLPMYAFADVAIGVCAAVALRRWRRSAAIILPILGVGLLTQTVAAYPDYIAFFNAAAGGSRGGLFLLGDSNLDWGQDLPLLAAWQRAHSDVRLYLCYFGEADPASYGIHATAYYDNPNEPMPVPPGMLAISATNLQGIYFKPEQRKLFTPLMHRQPLAVLGGSIYLYRLPINAPANQSSTTSRSTSATQ